MSYGLIEAVAGKAVEALQLADALSRLEGSVREIAVAVLEEDLRVIEELLGSHVPVDREERRILEWVLRACKAALEGDTGAQRAIQEVVEGLSRYALFAETTWDERLEEHLVLGAHLPRALMDIDYAAGSAFGREVF